MSTLLTRAESDASGAGRIMRSDAQPLWRDPATGYIRRAVSPPGAEPELVHVELPPGAYVNDPAAAYAYLDGQCVWMLPGALSFRAGTIEHHLAAGDCLTLGLPLDCAFTIPPTPRPAPTSSPSHARKNRDIHTWN
ncbi:cupin domain-containing protein [Nguyenibacter vanlangensis]|uniref:cupin domain-containing protein n=1 Tax=Nguyenibacter vanlangensis TaxID=1216886 RepID=UPI001FEB49E2|nr:cupin domain-containing protein [Nguyenibacter vanlangensis]